MKGVIKWFSKERGYGFILGEDNKNYFVHIKDIEGLDIPKEKDIVEFEITETEKGAQAINVKIIEKNTEKNTDPLVVCENCNKKMVPRVISVDGVLIKSVCPYCGSTYKDFRGEKDLTILIIFGSILFLLFSLIFIVAITS
ncbi:cold shock domain-containing protein [Persephonella sp. KM09-Lau-8]|uniref:cold shock domain-containing protein n=1 Tax=Persephonella sp. KM09-Lau-8 TaxID=1158345 RepID=UPI0004958135|nr:cold shock domain-containing protein [Persephonella sp. KM09-Lau-8]